MNPHALAVLEFAQVLALVAERASSELGAERVRSLAPSDERAAIEDEHARVAAMRSLLGEEGGWSMLPIPDLREPLARLRIAGTTLESRELLAARTLLLSSRRTSEALADPRLPAVASTVLRGIASRLVRAKAEEDAIERVIGDDGEVRDSASPLLGRLRRELRGAQGQLVALLERIVSRLESHHQVTDASVTVRNGRYVIPVRREARTVVGGIVHDTSTTGATLFVEPPAAVEMGNRIREVEAEEAREVRRLLLELTDRLRPRRNEMLDALEALTELDSLYARARFALDFRCAPCDLCPPAEGFAIREGRHPLLVAQGIDVVPFDLEMAPEERTLLVSGPNTGGKTVLLKTLGLMSVMVQAGIPAPVAAGSRVAIVDDIFADVGDEQSIEASLSTFSAHLKNLSEILAAATDRSLVLIDELGSGTDPVEGAALGGSILQELTNRGTLTVATTHLGALKELATEVTGVVNASLQFDPVALAPTYRLIKGIPGRSYGLSIARRLRLPDHVLDRAEERLPKGERDVNALLADLERRDEAVAEREQIVAESLDAAREKAHRLAERERRVREKERELERQSRREARRYLLDARAEIERTIKHLEAVGASAADEAAREARQRVERLAATHGRALDALEASDPVATTTAPTVEEPKVGELVELETLGWRVGRLIDLRDGDAVVAVGGIKMAVPFATLRRSRVQRAENEVIVPLRGDAPEVVAQSEIDLRGMRVDEIDEPLLQAIDSAIRADLHQLRVIHGKGTGALRARVTEMLRKDTRVKSFRLGAWNEGGAGVTVIDLR